MSSNEKYPQLSPADQERLRRLEAFETDPPPPLDRATKLGGYKALPEELKAKMPPLSIGWEFLAGLDGINVLTVNATGYAPLVMEKVEYHQGSLKILSPAIFVVVDRPLFECVGPKGFPAEFMQDLADRAGAIQITVNMGGGERSLRIYQEAAALAKSHRFDALIIETTDRHHKQWRKWLRRTTSGRTLITSLDQIPVH
jgi:hypothetical protein